MTEAVQTLPERDEERGPKPAGAPDDALLRRHLDGDASAFAELVTMYATPLYGYLTRCGVSPAERDDLFQEILVKVHRGAQTHPPEGALRPWLFTIAVNTVRSHFRKVKVRKVVHLTPDAGTDERAPTRSPEADADTRATARWVEREIAKLPLELREPLVLCAVQGLEMEEAASALDLPVGTVKTRLRRARLALAEAKARRDAKGGAR